MACSLVDIYRFFALDLTKLTILTTESKTLLSSVGIVIAIRASQCMKQCVEPTLGKSCFSLETNPLNLPVIAGAPSVQRERVQRKLHYDK
jgi:hypothetical protein